MNKQLEKLVLPDVPQDEIVAWLISIPNIVADTLLVDKVLNDMTIKLSKKRNEGYGGWHTPNCSSEYLKEELLKHLEKGDMIDVINFAAMIHCRNMLYKEVYLGEK